MSWKDLLDKEEKIVLPWLGGKRISSPNRSWKIQGNLPREFGWYAFLISGRNATLSESAIPEPEILKNKIAGYLVGDRLITNDVKVTPTISNLNLFERVFLIENGLDKFVRISAGRIYDNGPLIFHSIEMPLGPEMEALDCFLDGKENLDNIPGINHTLDAAFRIEIWLKIEIEKRRKEEQERREAEERRRRFMENVSSAVDRRITARDNFEEAARAALFASGAEFIDSRRGLGNEMIVRFRFINRRFECTCDKNTLGIIDSGICLTDESTGIKYDHTLSLESLPPVIKQADDEDKLVIFRHV